jgi:hypothetical protein
MFKRKSVLSSVVLLLLASKGPLLAAETCSRYAMDPPPGWANSGAWTADGKTLLLADSLKKRILQFSRDGKFEGDLPGPINSALGSIAPRTIRQQGDKFFIEITGNRVLTLDQSYHVRGKQAVEGTGVKNGIGLHGMFLWQPVGSDLITLSDLQTPDQRWQSAFVRFPLGDPSKFEILHQVSFMDPSKVFYRLGYPYTASLGEDGYILLMENNMGIYRSRKGVNGLEPLSAFPEGVGQSPILPAFITQEDFPPVMRKVEKSKMPAGLYGWDRFLYMLVREPARDGTRWTIFKIDPRQDRIVDSTRIPTRANHLTIIPGPASWAVLEKGPVEGFGRQRIENVLFVPSGRLRGDMPDSLCTVRNFRK